MEKEKVLEIEFQEIWGKYAWRIVKNTIPFEIEEVHNDEVKLVRHQDNIYIFDDFEGLWDILDDEILIYEEDKIKIENFVTEINHKYCRPRRWRGQRSDKYFTIFGDGEFCETVDNYFPEDQKRYELGNYFKTEEEAQKVKIELDKFWERVRNGEMNYES